MIGKKRFFPSLFSFGEEFSGSDGTPKSWLFYILQGTFRSNDILLT